MTPIVLKVYDGGKLKGARTFRAERIRLGSGAVDLVLEGASIAPTHAVIEAGALGVVIRATTSAPLYVNGQPVLAAPLRHGDLVTIGELRVMVELQKAAQGPQSRRPRLQIIDGAPDALIDPGHSHAPALQVVREGLQIVESSGPEAEPEVRLELEAAEREAPAPAPLVAAAPLEDDDVALPAAVLAPPRVLPSPGASARLPPLGAGATLGGDCVEVELFWGDTRVGVWQLQPGDRLAAGSAQGCDALLPGIERAEVLKSDSHGWTVFAPRPLGLTLEEEGKTLGGPELLARGRSQADAQGLVVPLQPQSVAVLHGGNLALRIRRVRSVSRAGGERTDWKGVLVASVAAVLMLVVLRVWSDSVPPARTFADPELIRPRPVAVRSAMKPVAPRPDDRSKNEGRRDPGKAVARHEGQEGQAGDVKAPRREARAQRKLDDRAVIAQVGLLKALGGGKGSSDVFGVALEKGAKDAMGHLNGPRVADARGDGGLGLRSLGGHGGGGDGSGLGLARIGTNGIGGGLAAYGDGKGGLRGKEDGDIGLSGGKPQVVGSIDPELIRKVVHEHRAQIRTCYETQLTSRPNLAGKLVAAWTIDPAGAVTEAHAQESTLHDHAVEACVASRIRTWRFPIPKGGGEVFVTYPFIFTPGG